MSVVSSHPQETVDNLTLADLLKPMQFKTVLLVACGLKNCEIAEVLGTREQVIENALADVYHRTGCWNSGELVRRYFREVATGLLELGRLQRELSLRFGLDRIFLRCRKTGFSTSTDGITAISVHR